MIHPHNPVMQRLGEMARCWQQEVRSTHRLVRWMLRPEDNRMYEGFCRLEASSHGALDNLFLFFNTPFGEADQFSYALMEHWMQEYDGNTEQRQALIAAGVKGDWDTAVFREAVTGRRYARCNVLLPQMINTYREWLGMPQTDIVLALLPGAMTSPTAFKTWLKGWMEREIPIGVQLLIFDHIQTDFFRDLFGQYPDYTCTLQHDLRMEEAIREIATAGAATDPQAAFRECLFEMGEAAARKNRQHLQDWGEKALAIGKKSGDRLLLATAYISYAGMLFNFRDYEKIGSMLEDGMTICRKGIERGEESMKSLLLQYYAYKGSHCQLIKERRDAIRWFMRMGVEAVGFGYFTQALSAYYKAFIFARYKHFDEEKDRAILEAMQLSDRLGQEEIAASEYPFLAYAFAKDERVENRVLRSQAADKMKDLYGPDWKNNVEEMEKNYTRQRIRELEYQALMEE
jgi:hypothetical protein